LRESSNEISEKVESSKSVRVLVIPCNRELDLSKGQEGRKFHTVVALHIAYTMSRSSRYIQGGILQNKKEKNQPPFSPPSIWPDSGKLTGLEESRQNTT